MKIYNVSAGIYGDRWLDKTEDEQHEMFVGLKRAFNLSDGKGLLACTSQFADDRANAFSMDEFPNVAAYETFLTELQTVEWDRHFTGFRLTGTPVEGFENVDWQVGDEGETDQVYKLWMMQGTPAYFSASDAERAENLENTNAALKKAGGRRLMICHPLNNQTWFLFGVEVFPSMGDAMSFQLELSKNSVTKYTHSQIYIGRPWGNYANVTVKGTPE